MNYSVTETETGVRTVLLDPSADEDKLEFGGREMSQYEMFHVLQNHYLMSQEDALIVMHTKMLVKKGRYKI